MKTAQDGLIAHIEAGNLGFETVKRYAGEIGDAIRNRNTAILTTLMPAAFVLYADGAITDGQGRYQLDVIVVTETFDLDVQDNADDGIGLAETLARWLENNFVYGQDGNLYDIDLSQDIDAETMLVTTAHTIARVSVLVQEQVGSYPVPPPPLQLPEFEAQAPLTYDDQNLTLGLQAGDATTPHFVWNGSAWVPGKVAWSDLSGVPATFPPSAHGHDWGDLTSVPPYASRWPDWTEVTNTPKQLPASPTDGQFAAWDAGAGQWVAVNAPTGGPWSDGGDHIFYSGVARAKGESGVEAGMVMEFDGGGAMCFSANPGAARVQFDRAAGGNRIVINANERSRVLDADGGGQNKVEFTDWRTPDGFFGRAVANMGHLGDVEFFFGDFSWNGYAGPQELIHANGNIRAEGDFISAVDTNGLVLTSPDGSRWRLTIDNAGSTTWTKL